jgi:hypothetical protein
VSRDNRPGWISRRRAPRCFAVGETDRAITWAAMPWDIRRLHVSALPRLLAAGMPRPVQVGRARYWSAARIDEWLEGHRDLVAALAAEAAS